MSHTNHRGSRGVNGRPRRQAQGLSVEGLEDRKLPAPVVAGGIRTAALTNITDVISGTTPTQARFTANIVVTETASPNTAAPLTSVAQLTSANSFGGDIVRIEAGPGGDFGKGVYAISRGAGENADSTSRDSSVQAPINRPGVIYRIDPATGKTSVFFDLNTVQSQLTPPGTGANGSTPGSGLLNSYDLAFDSEGIFDGKPSLFVTSLSTSNANQNIIYRIGPDGSFLGAYVSFTAGGGSQNFTRQPSAILVPPVEQQNFLKGLFVGNGATSATTGGFTALFFDANSFRPGTDLNGTTLPNGVVTTGFTQGPQVAFTAANSSYNSPDYSVFTDFGAPSAGGVQPSPGLSGMQGLQGELLINNGANVVTNATGGFLTPNLYYNYDPNALTPDLDGAITTPFRRFQDAAFDQYGYFSYSTSATATPAYQGSMFATDLATGLAVNVDSQGGANGFNIPVQGNGSIDVTVDFSGAQDVPVTVNAYNPGNIGGRVVRISPTGVVTPFAENFHTSGAMDANGFLQSELSISFSADGTILYVSDDDGVWQFKTVTDVANATSGQLIGLGDLRTFGVPYDGQDSAVAIVDTGVDALTPNFRGRVATGYNTLTNGNGNDDTATAGNGHGTIVAGVIAQFVPQATLNPINVFTPNQVVPGVGASAGGNATTPQNIYLGLDFVAKNPFVKDPVRANTENRTVAANISFGTTTTYQTETGAYKSFPQVTIAFKNEFKKFRDLGISPIAAAGQFGTPSGASVTASVTGGDVSGMAFPAVLNEAISVTGSYPFPYTGDSHTNPTDPGTGVVPRPPGPLLLYGTGSTIGGTLNGVGTASVVAAGDQLVFKDKLLASSNRGLTTDYTAPELDIPSWSRTVNGSLGGTVAGSVGGTGGNATFGFNNFQEGGTSLSSAIVTGSFAMVESALDYWHDIAVNNGVTIDGYLNTPVGTHQLNFGKGGVEDLSAYTNTDGINSILEWTSVPATDAPNTLETTNPPTLFRSTSYRQYARIDVGNAIAAIEGSIALNYLFAHGSFDVIDSNKNGLITAQEVQNFVDNSANTGMAEAGAMARFLGGTARIPGIGNPITSAAQSPEQPDALARRYNFFDYAADGQSNGAISIDQYRILAKNLLPSPDSFQVTDRQRASAQGFLLSPSPTRNIADLQHVLPTYAFIPKKAVARYKNISPAKFGVGRGQLPSFQTPIFTLFADGKQHVVTKQAAKQIAASATPAKTTGATTAAKPTTTTTKPTTTTTTTTTTNAANSTANAYIAALANLAQAGQTSSNHGGSSSTVVSQPRQIGAAAAATASGTGSTVNSSSTETVTTSQDSTPPMATSSSMAARDSSSTSSTDAVSSTATPATVQTQVVPQTADQAAENSASEAKRSVTAPLAAHVAAIPKVHHVQTPHEKALARARVKASSNKFDFWNPWTSFKNLVRKK